MSRHYGVPEYVNRAGYEFLRGLPYKSPIQAIEAGVRSIDEWCATLDAYRPASLINITREPRAPRVTPSKDRITALLEECPDLTAPEIAERLGLAVTTAMTRVAELHKAGVIVRDFKSHKHRPRYRVASLTERAA